MPCSLSLVLCPWKNPLNPWFFSLPWNCIVYGDLLMCVWGMFKACVRTFWSDPLNSTSCRGLVIETASARRCDNEGSPCKRWGLGNWVQSKERFSSIKGIALYNQRWAPVHSKLLGLLFSNAFIHAKVEIFYWARTHVAFRNMKWIIILELAKNNPLQSHFNSPNLLHLSAITVCLWHILLWIWYWLPTR